ncbi:MAG: DUF6064 family protein [Sphingomonas sp.]
MLSFTHQQFLLALAAYQDSIWPAQPVAYALGALATVVLVKPKDLFRRLTLGILALLWAWAAIAYHWLFFTDLTGAALLFGLLFAAQTGLLFFAAVRRRAPPDLSFRANPAGFAGAALIGYALLVYPLLDFWLLAWPRMPWLGISPCPVTLFTLGFLLFSAPRLPVIYWVVPVAWALFEGMTAVLLGILQDWALLLAGVAAILLALAGDDRTRSIPPKGRADPAG